MVNGRLRAELDRAVDGASVAVFRATFGGLLVVSTLRFFRHGWVEKYYGTPKHFFQYWGFGWVHPFSLGYMYALYAVIAVSAVGIALGVAFRASAVVFTLAFSYAHFCDKANYLNHYYLVSLIGALFCFLPLDRDLSLSAWLRPASRRGSVRAWVLWLLRFQIGVVYVFGGVGKLNGDWLVHAEPLRIWLAANREMPVLGRLFLSPATAFAFSWAGALFDLSIVPLLCLERTRAFAFALVVFFHLMTAALFNIGMFPWIMLGAAPLFFDPSWPRRVFARLRLAALGVRHEGLAGRPIGAGLGAALGVYCAIQVLLPLRSALYPGNTLWTEEGFRFSWKVMLIDKIGVLEYDVVDARGRHFSVSPREYMTAFQTRMASTQPDMIAELAHLIARDFERRGYGSVRVYADARVAFNGRKSAPIVDPRVDLARVSDGLAAKPWILPAPTSEPAS